MRVNRLSLNGVIVQLTKAIALGYAKIEQGQVVSKSSGTDLLIQRYIQIRPEGHNLLQAIKSV
jgi:hypothetical protein